MRLKRWILGAAYAGALAIAFAVDTQDRVVASAAPYTLSANDGTIAYTGIVLGCRVNDGEVGNCLEERMERALALYRDKSVQRLLLSGDHGRRGYDEVNAMKHWLTERGVPLEHIFLDHAGFDTYDSMVRAKRVFQIDRAIIVTQSFHLPRALYLARACGIEAFGAGADPPEGSVCGGSAVREPMACVKAWWNVNTGASPRFLGPAIPITGSSQLTFDQSSDSLR
jgi:SanA protein